MRGVERINMRREEWDHRGRVTIAPMKAASPLAVVPLAGQDLGPTLAGFAAWRSDERRRVRQVTQPQPGWWPKEER